MYLSDKLQDMKKQIKKYSVKTSAGSKVEELDVPYAKAPIMYFHQGSFAVINEFKYSSFKSILKKSPFTISEWAQLLYISERTLHRYAKENLSFNGLHTERILLLEEFIDTGIELLGKEGLKQWVHSSPFSLGGPPVFDCLYTYQGIRASIDTLQKAQHGIPA